MIKKSDIIEQNEKKQRPFPPKKKRYPQKQEVVTEQKPKDNPTQKKKQTFQNSKPQNPQKPQGKPTLKVIPLGGLEEIGKNMTVFEYEGQMIIVDCGIGFPDEELLGIDLLIPNFDYLKKNKNKIKGLFVTHGHEDHVGGIPYFLQEFQVPVYCTKLTAGIIQNKNSEFTFDKDPVIHEVKAGDVIRLGAFSVEFVHVNHSIPDACALYIKTPVATVFHTGDFKIDNAPIDGKVIDLARIGAIGKEGVTLMLGESTNAERPGFTPSERVVGTTIEQVLSKYHDKRIIISTFSSNVHRIQQLIDSAVKHKRKVVIMGRSMANIIVTAKDLGYMSIPDDTIIDITEISKYRAHQLCFITTGSQGEPMAALSRIIFGEENRIHLSHQDVVVLSSHPIPGNEKLIGKVINALTKQGIKVVDTGTADVHASGHACQEELKLMLGLVNPQYFMPIHGENRHLSAHKELALQLGIPSNHIFIGEIGRVLELTKDQAKLGGKVPCGTVYIDGAGVGDVQATIIKERKQLSEDGLILVSFLYDPLSGTIVGAPKFEAKGFVNKEESNTLFKDSEKIIFKVLSKKSYRKKAYLDDMKIEIERNLLSFIASKTKKKPLIMCVILTTM